MSETIKLSFDDGYKNIELNGNPDKIIRINQQILSLLTEFQALMRNMRIYAVDTEISI